MVAEELFGTEAVKLKFKRMGDADDAFVPKAKLIFSAAATGEAITANTEFEVTYTLSNATFAEQASPVHFHWGRWGPSLGADCASGGTGANADDATKLAFCTTSTISNEVRVSLEEGGGTGDSSVTYKVKANQNVDFTRLSRRRPYTGETRMIVWAVPDLNAQGLLAPYRSHPNGRDVTVSTAIRLTGGNTPISDTLTDGNACGNHLLGGARLLRQDKVVSCPVVEAVAMVSVSATDGPGGEISAEGGHERKILVNAKGLPVDPQRAHIATVTVTADKFADEVRDADGDKITGFTGPLAGRLTVSVASDGLRDGDTVYIDANSNKRVDGREAFEIDGATATDTVALKAGRMAVYYVPNGAAPMEHRTTFATSAATEFDGANNKVKGTSVPAAGQLKLHGIEMHARAYAISPPGSTDVANVLVKCENSAAAGCNVFLDCRDEGGTGTFGDVGMVVRPNQTVNWNSMQIAEMLGLDEGWEGLLACDVLSSAPISVQVLTRTAGVIANLTAISSKRTGGTGGGDSGMSAGGGTSVPEYAVDEVYVPPGHEVNIYATPVKFAVRTTGTGCVEGPNLRICTNGALRIRNWNVSGETRFTLVGSRNQDISWTLYDVEPEPP